MCEERAACKCIRTIGNRWEKEVYMREAVDLYADSEIRKQKMS